MKKNIIKNKSIALFLLAALTLNTGSQLRAGWRESLLPVSPLSGEIMWDAAGDAAVAAISSNRGFLLGAVTLAGAAGAIGYMRSKRVAEEHASTQDSAASYFTAPQLTREEQEQNEIEDLGLSRAITAINNGTFARTLGMLITLNAIEIERNAELCRFDGRGGNSIIQNARATVVQQAAERSAALQAEHDAAAALAAARLAAQGAAGDLEPDLLAMTLGLGEELDLSLRHSLAPVEPAIPAESPLVHGDIWTAAPVAALPQGQQNQERGVTAPLKRSFFSRFKKAASEAAKTVAEGMHLGMITHTENTRRPLQQGLLRR